MKIGDKVIDSSGTTGFITSNNDPHNIEVDYDKDDGCGVYCIVKECDMYDGLKLYEEN